MFKIGDSVRVIRNYSSARKGMKGTIKAKGSQTGRWGIEFDEKFGSGHDCGGKTQNGHGYWVPPECLELIKPKAEKIVITHDGKTTLARLYEDNKVVKSAEAKCSPDDEFSFTVGAKLAFERLTEEKEEPPFKVGDVVKVKAAEYHFFMDGTLGKVTEVVDEGMLEVMGYDSINDLMKTQRICIEDCEKVK